MMMFLQTLLALLLLLLPLLLPVCVANGAEVVATSFPVLHCTNYDASPTECHSDVKAVVQAMDYWFKPFEDNYRKSVDPVRRHSRQLIDCTRFCDPSITYFSVHAPCDCTAWSVRHLESTPDGDTTNDVHEATATSTDTVPPPPRQLLGDLSPLEGPIQIFQAYTASIQDAHCKAIFTASKCVVNFVQKYTNEIRTPEDVGTVESEEKEAESDFLEDTSEGDMDQDAKNAMVKRVRYDPDTGEVIDESPDGTPVDDENHVNAVGGGGTGGGSEYASSQYDSEEQEEEEAMNSEHGGYVHMNTGKRSDPDANEDEDEEGAAFRSEHGGSILNPITGKRVDPKTGNDINDDLVQDEEFVDEEMNSP